MICNDFFRLTGVITVLRRGDMHPSQELNVVHGVHFKRLNQKDKIVSNTFFTSERTNALYVNKHI